MRPILIRIRARARRADWAPGPGVLVPLPSECVSLHFRLFSTSVQHTSGSTDLDVEGSDANLLAAGSNIFSSQHSGVWRRLVTIGLDLHSTGDTDNSFLSTITTSQPPIRQSTLSVHLQSGICRVLPQSSSPT